MDSINLHDVITKPLVAAEKRARGRPRGAQNEASKVLAREKAIFNKKASLRANKILNATTIAALGTHHLLELIRDPKNHAVILERHIVRDVKRQETFLDEGEYGEDYIIVEGTPADWRAGDAILNRAWGKPKETVEVDHTHTFTLRAAHEKLQVTSPEHIEAIDITDAASSALDAGAPSSE